MTENPGKLVPLGIVHIDDHRDQLMKLIETRWQDGQLALWGRRKDTSHPFENIKEYKGLELLWMAGPEKDGYYCDVQAHPSVIGKRGYYQHRWEEIQIREEDLEQLCAEIAETAPGTETVSQSDSIPLTEAVHDLRIARRTDLRSAISEVTDLLATGQLPPADALVDGGLVKIDPRWWWAGAIDYPNSSAAFNLIIDAEPRLTRATEIALDRRAWERQRSRVAASAQQGEASGEPVLADMGEPQPSTHPESAQSPARANAPRSRAPDVEVRQWYQGTYIPECQTTGKRPSEAMDWAEAKLKFGNKVRRNQIRDVRHALAPDDWRIQGRRPSSTNSAENSAE